MVEEIIQTIKRAMMPDLAPAQMEKLENVLCITLHGKKITEERNELAATGEDGDVAKINMFLGSKKTTGRADGTLQQYSREIYNMLDFLGKRLDALEEGQEVLDGAVNDLGSATSDLADQIGGEQ